MATEKAIQTKDKIFNAAVKVFSQKGFSASTTNEIAKEAGVAEGSIFRYYKTKKDILRGVMLDYVEKFEEILDLNSIEILINENKGKSIEHILKALILNRFSIFKKYGPMLKVVNYEIQFHDDIKRIYYEKIMKKENLIAKLIAEEIKDNEKYNDVDANVIFKIFHSMLLGSFISIQCENKEYSIVDVEKEANLLIDVFLNGIRKKQ